MLIAVKFLALSHLLVNAALHDVLLFGSFLVWAVTDRISLKYREQLIIPTLPVTRIKAALALIIGLTLYPAFIFGVHAWLIGVAILPS